MKTPNSDGSELSVNNKRELDGVLEIEPHLLDQIVVVENGIQEPVNYNNWYAGLAVTDCTSGFTVRDRYNVSLRYTTTAGHCNNSNISPLPPAGVIHDYYEVDFSVHNVPNGHVLRNWARDNTAGGTTPFYRVITSYTFYPNTNDFVCKYGKTTGYTCGNITSTSATSGGHTQLLRIQPTTYWGACPGDSGGPVYNGSTAIGLIQGGPDQYCNQPGSIFYATKLQGVYNYGYVVAIQ